MVSTEAQYFAIGAHGAQKRKYTGNPYWWHLADVVEILKTHTKTCSEQMLMAAWLHDVVEDTCFGLFDIDLFFGSKVSGYVAALTEPPHSFGNRSKRKAFYSEQLANADPEVQTIKYADLIDNCSSIVKHDPDFAKVYLKEKEQLLKVMDKGDPLLYKMACECIK